MILTITPNPTIDRVLFVDSFALPDVVRATGEAVSPSGKAIDVAIVLRTFGAQTFALGCSAGLSGRMLEDLMDEWDTPYDFVEAEGTTRVAALITDIRAHRQSTVIANTLTATQAHFETLKAKATAKLSQSWGMVCAGSLPPGMPADAYAQLLALAHQYNCTTFLDSSGESLRQAISVRPDILKVNLSELNALAPEVGKVWSQNYDGANLLESVSKLVDVLSKEVEKWARQTVIVTLGKQGAVAVTPEGRWYVPALEVGYVSPAGAGDGMTSGIMLALYRGGSWRDALALGTAVAANVVTNAGTCECHPDDVEALLPQVELIDI